MSDYTKFKTDDIDLAAFLEASGHSATVGRDVDQPLAVFTFKRDSGLLNHLEQYVSGSALIQVKGLLDSRRRLFRSIRNLQGGRS